MLLIEYLQNVDRINPKPGFNTSTTTLYGIQRPPLHTQTVIRCTNDCSWDMIAPSYITFFATDARSQVVLSIDSENEQLIALAEKHKLVHVVETEEACKQRGDKDQIFQIVRPTQQECFPMVDTFIGQHLPFGHIKSTQCNDEEFVLRAKMSYKWLNTLF